MTQSQFVAIFFMTHALLHREGSSDMSVVLYTVSLVISTIYFLKALWEKR